MVVAALVSSVASYFLLARQRTELAVAVEARVSAARTKAAERTAREDAIADEILAEQERAQHQD